MAAEGFPLSPQQKRLWQLQQADCGLPDCVRCAILIDGPLDRTLLEEVVRAVFARHEIFHTAISCLSVTTIPVQDISERNIPSIDNHDMCSWEPREQAVALESLFRKGSELAFDRDEGLSAHLALATLSAD